MNFKDLAERAVWTFVEGFTAALTLAGVLDLSISALKAAALGGGMAVLSLVKNVAKQHLETQE